MDFKAIISNCGDEKLYKGLSSEVERRLPASTVGWKRSFGRPEKPVVLQAIFSKFNSTELLNNNVIDSLETLASKPMLHVYWTSCLDIENYKTVVKGKIGNWQKHLLGQKSDDWLIIHVLYQDNSKPTKSKLQLPRSSVFDKIKSDFAQGRQDRCVQLWEPDKETLFTKSSESWQILLQQLRGFLLQSFGRHLESFEDRIRGMREKYADPSWPFINYFLVHEELAFIYQNITLNEDALVQYDEVDALLSQFIINNSGKELPLWLNQLSAKPSNWDGVILSSTVADMYKKVIKSNAATLLELRNYLFMRQCKLLSKLKRKWEIPSRLQEFLFTVIHELKLLKVDVSEQVVACWIILTCLQILPILEKEETNERTFFAIIAQVYDFMRKKFHLLGQVTGLYFHKPQTEEEKEVVNQLKSGFGKFTRNKSHAINSIQEALSSPQSYQKLYAEITQNCIDKYSKINRMHFNMFVGIDLAKFYLHHGRYDEAEPLLEKSWSIYKTQKWEKLYSDVLIPLAACQLKHELHCKYFMSVTLLSCAKCLPLSTREFYSKEVLRLSAESSLTFPVTSFDPVFKVVNVQNHLIRYKGHIGDTVRISVTIINNLTLPVTCKQFNIVAKHRDLSNPDSFSENVLSARKSLFDQTDYGMDFAISPPEKPVKVIEVKEPLTPSALIKRIKSQRRTWSRNKNTLESEKVETTSISEPVPSSLENSQTSLVDSEENESDGGNPHGVGGNPNPNRKESNTEKAMIEVEDEKDEKAQATCEVKKSLFQGEPNQLEDECNEEDGENRRKSLLELASLDICDSRKIKDTRNISNSNAGLSLDLSGLSQEDKSSTPMKPEDSISSNQSSSVFLTPDVDEILDVTLKSDENIILQPGENDLIVSSKVIHEGKYTFQCTNCVVGSLSFYKSLKNMSRTSGSFFMVADPPRVTWTSEYLVDYVLTGSKQRIHVTLMNGPGVIEEDSTVCVFSGTGLKFYSLGESTIKIFPIERNGKARQAKISVSVDNEKENAYIKLPVCQPYERVNVFFDVIAPMHQEFGEMSTCQHEIKFSCEWLESLVSTIQRLDLIFYEPFQVRHDILIMSSGVFIKITLCGVNPVHLVFTNPQLVISGTDKQLESIIDVDNIDIYNIEEVCMLWKVKVDDNLDDKGDLNCDFMINFKTKVTKEQQEESFTKSLTFHVNKCILAVDLVLPDKLPTKNQQCSVTVIVHTLHSFDLNNSRLVLKLDSREHFWKNADQENLELVCNESDHTCDVTLICTVSGVVNTPLFTIYKISNDPNESTLEVLTSFEPGEVEYLSSGKMMLVNDQANVVTDV